MKRFGATPHAPQLSRDVKRGDIAPDRRFGSTGQVNELRHCHHRPVGDFTHDDAVALDFVHGCSQREIINISQVCQSRTIISDNVAAQMSILQRDIA
jgi:hypothetical protein